MDFNTIEVSPDMMGYRSLNSISIKRDPFMPNTHIIKVHSDYDSLIHRMVVGEHDYVYIMKHPTKDRLTLSCGEKIELTEELRHPMTYRNVRCDTRPSQEHIVSPFPEAPYTGSEVTTPDGIWLTMSYTYNDDCPQFSQPFDEFIQTLETALGIEVDVESSNYYPIIIRLNFDKKVVVIELCRFDQLCVNLISSDSVLVDIKTYKPDGSIVEYFKGASVA